MPNSQVAFLRRRTALSLALLISFSSSLFALDGHALLEQKRFRLLYHVANERVTRNAQDAEALVWLSAVYDAEGDLGHAADLAQRATQAAPNSSEAHCQMADVLGDRALKAGVMGGGLNYARQMRHEVDRSLELDPRNIRCLKESMGLYEQVPALAGGSKSKARELQQRIASINASEGALAAAALAQMDKRPLREIEAQLRRAVLLNARNYRALTDLTAILLSDNFRQYGEAERFARQATVADPARALGYAQLATALARQQKLNEIDGAMQLAMHHVSEDASPMYAAAVALLESSSANATALAHAEKYLRYYLAHTPEIGAPSHASAHWKLALVLEKQGRKNDAAKEVHAAAAEHENNAEFKRDYKRIAG